MIIQANVHGGQFSVSLCFCFIFCDERRNIHRIFGRRIFLDTFILYILKLTENANTPTDDFNTASTIATPTTAVPITTTKLSTTTGAQGIVKV